MYIFTIIGISVNTPDLINRYVFLSQRLMVPYKLLFYMRMENYYLFPFTLKTYSKMFLLCILEYWMDNDNWTVSDVTGYAGVIGQYLANAIISDKSK